MVSALALVVPTSKNAVIRWRGQSSASFPVCVEPDPSAEKRQSKLESQLSSVLT